MSEAHLTGFSGPNRDTKPPWLMSDIEALRWDYTWRRDVLCKVSKSEGQSTDSHVINSEIDRLDNLIRVLSQYR